MIKDEEDAAFDVQPELLVLSEPPVDPPFNIYGPSFQSEARAMKRLV